MVRAAVLLALAAAPAAPHADGHALSAGLGWATFSVPGKKTGTMEPPSVSPDIGGTVSGIYEYSVSTDFSLRGEAAGGLFYGGQTKDQSATSWAVLVDAGITFRFDV